MKLPIKKKFFDLIKAGEKDLEWRDAHITFVCEETGETLRREIISAEVMKKGKFEDWEEGMFESRIEFNKLFTDEKVIVFYLKAERQCVENPTLSEK